MTAAAETNVRLSKSAHYALLAAVELARAAAPVSVAQVAARHGLPEGALAKVFQALVRAGILQGTRGAGGGYRLTRPAADVSVLQVVEIFDRPVRAAESPAPTADRLQQLFREIDEGNRSTFASVSLETLTR